MQNFKEAVDGFSKLLEIDPNNKAAKNQRIICLHKIKQQHEKEKKTYQGMFAKFAEADSKVKKILIFLKKYHFIYPIYIIQNENTSKFI